MTYTNCIRGPGAPHRTGYHRQTRKGIRKGAHEWAYIDKHGEIPEGKQINHHCDNRACVNPEHLYAGTQADNMRDRWERNPSNHNGEYNPSAKLNNTVVHWVRSSDMVQEWWAEKLGVTQPAISKQMTKYKRKQKEVA